MTFLTRTGSLRGAAGVVVRRGEVAVRGVRSLLIETGLPVSPEVVVFVHGNPGSSEDWAPLVAKTG